MKTTFYSISAAIIVAVFSQFGWAQFGWAESCCEPACCEPSCCEATCCDPACCDTACCGYKPACCKTLGGIEISGWVESGIFANAYGAPNNGPLGFNEVGDGYVLNQLWFSFDKATDTGGCGIDWGGHVDYIFGVDGPDTQCFGDETWDFGWNSARDYGSAISQAYFELAINDLTIKGGHFYTIIGWEVVQAPDNFFYTHAYTMYYGEPFTHTGFLASYKLNDKVTLHGGWTDGWDDGWTNPHGASTFLGGVNLSLTNKASLNWACSTGTFGDNDGEILGNVYMNSIVFDYKLTERFTYILQHDLGNIYGAGATPGQWYGINQYLQYQLNDRWAAGVRIEWFRDDDGTRVPINAAGDGNPGNYYEVTWGLNYTPCKSLIVRPELRYDWFDGSVANGAPFDNNTKTAQFSGGFDFIYKF